MITTMQKNDSIIAILEKLGLRPKVDEDNLVVVRYQSKYIYCMATDEDEDPYVSMVYPQFTEIEEGEDMLVLAACNKITREMKMLKTYVDQNCKSVSAACEFFFTDEESLEDNIKRSLQMLGVARTVFRNAKKELSD